MGFVMHDVYNSFLVKLLSRFLAMSKITELGWGSAPQPMSIVPRRGLTVSLFGLTAVCGLMVVAILSVLQFQFQLSCDPVGTDARCWPPRLRTLSPRLGGAQSSQCSPPPLASAHVSRDASVGPTPPASHCNARAVRVTIVIWILFCGGWDLLRLWALPIAGARAARYPRPVISITPSASLRAAAGAHCGGRPSVWWG